MAEKAVDQKNGHRLALVRSLSAMVPLWALAAGAALLVADRTAAQATSFRDENFVLDDGTEVTNLDTVDGQEIIEYLKQVTPDDVSVQCQAQQMCIRINKEFLARKNITRFYDKLELDDIRQGICAPNFLTGATSDAVSHVELCTVGGFLTCGTEMHMNDTHVSYVNNVKTKNEENLFREMSAGMIFSEIVKEYVIPWHCIYPLEYIVHLQHGYYIPKISRPQVITIVSPRLQKVQKFPVMMQLYQTGEWQTPYSNAPTLRDTDQLFVEVRLISAPEKATIRILKCWATPAGDRYGTPYYNLIDNYCEVPRAAKEAAVKISRNGEAKTARFTSNVFQFDDPREERVYLHCHVEVCFDELGQNCKKTCTKSTGGAPVGGIDAATGRVRREIDTDDVNSVLDDRITTVTMGPVRLRPEVFSVKGPQSQLSHDVSRNKASNPNRRFVVDDKETKIREAKTVFGLPMVFIYCFIGIIVIIIALIFGIIVLVLRRRAAARQHDKSLQIIDSNGQAFVISQTNSHFTDHTDSTSAAGSMKSGHNFEKAPPVILLKQTHTH